MQILGRGMRIAPGKENCLVLDFARNVERHGPIDALFVKAPGEGGGESPFKVCPQCQNYVLGRARVCSCGYEFPIESVVKLTPVSSDLQPLSDGRPHWIKADAWDLCRWTKPGGPPSLRVTYRWGDRIYREWVCFEHAGLPREKARYWWEDCGGRPPVPATVTEALARRGELSCPPAIALGREGRYWQVTRRLPHSVPP